MELNIDPAQGLRAMREKIAVLITFLSTCRIIVTSSVNGAPYFELEKTRCSIWEITGNPEEFLDQVWEDEESERSKQKSSVSAQDKANIPVPQEKTPGTFVISIKDVQGKRPDISSKQVLQQFIQRGGFLVLEVICSHVPPWIEVEAELRGFTLETERIDKDTVKVRLTTSSCG